MVEMRLLRGIAVALAASAALVCAAAPTLAAPGATRAEQESLYRKSLAHPSDYQTAFAYVQVSEALGDYEAAIGMLERLLFYNQDLPRVKFEIGALYFRLGSYEMAQRYFNEALATPGIDAITRSRIAAYLPAVQKELQPARSWLYLNGGIRYQSNASATPDSRQILSGGAPLPIDLSQPHGADWNAYQIAQFANDFGFGSQRQNTLETRVSGYLTEQFRLSDLNIASINATVGPRLLLGKIGRSEYTIKPYVIGSATSVGGASPSTNAGAGVTLTAPLGNDVALSPFVEWQRAWYDNASNQNATLGNSDIVNTGLSAAIKFSDAVQMTVKGGYDRGTAANGYQSYTGYSAEIAFALRFDPPSRTMAHKWTLGPFARFSSIAFDAPNANIDPTVARSDRSWEVGVGLDAPLTPHFGFNAAVTYARTNSNIPNYSYDDWSAMLGTTARF